MRRNMDLVRTILIRLERSPGGWAPRDLNIIDFSLQEIGYHVHIMSQEGLVEAPTADSQAPEATPTSLTWKGHELLDLARDQERWNRAKAIVAKVGGAPIAVWMKVLTDLLLQGVDAATTTAS